MQGRVADAKSRFLFPGAQAELGGIPLEPASASSGDSPLPPGGGALGVLARIVPWLGPMLHRTVIIESAQLTNPVPAPPPVGEWYEDRSAVTLPLFMPWLGRPRILDEAWLRNPVPAAPRPAISGMPLLARVPEGIVEEKDLRRRLARFTDLVSIVHNSLVRQGILVQTDVSEFTIDADALLDGLTGTYE